MKRLLILALMITNSLAWAAPQVPNEAHTFNFNLKMSRHIARNKERKVLNATELIARVFASDEFRRRVLNHRYGGRKRFQYNNGLTNQQIYKLIMDGAEKLKPHRNNTMDMQLEFYTNHDTTVVGYTYPHTNTVWINTKYFNRHPLHKVAANLTHEWLHKVGFGHDYEKSTGRKYSVPYAIGYIVRDLAKKVNRGFILR